MSPPTDGRPGQTGLSVFWRQLVSNRVGKPSSVVSVPPRSSGVGLRLPIAQCDCRLATGRTTNWQSKIDNWHDDPPATGVVVLTSTLPTNFRKQFSPTQLSDLRTNKFFHAVASSQMQP